MSLDTAQTKIHNTCNHPSPAKPRCGFLFQLQPPIQLQPLSVQHTECERLVWIIPQLVHCTSGDCCSDIGLGTRPQLYSCSLRGATSSGRTAACVGVVVQSPYSNKR